MDGWWRSLPRRQGARFESRASGQEMGKTAAICRRGGGQTRLWRCPPGLSPRSNRGDGARSVLTWRCSRGRVALRAAVQHLATRGWGGHAPTREACRILLRTQHIYTHTHARTHTNVRTRTHTLSPYTDTLSTHTRTHARTSTHTHTHTHTRARAHTHTHTHTHTLSLSLSEVARL
jgi:hypothetical protein